MNSNWNNVKSLLPGALLGVLCTIPFSPFGADWLCQLFPKTIHLSGKIVDRNTGLPLMARVELSGNAEPETTDNLGRFDMPFKTKQSRYPGCPCNRQSIKLMVYAKGREPQSYFTELGEIISPNPTPMTLLFPPAAADNHFIQNLK